MRAIISSSESTFKLGYDRCFNRTDAVRYSNINWVVYHESKRRHQHGAKQWRWTGVSQAVSHAVKFQYRFAFWYQNWVRPTIFFKQFANSVLYCATVLVVVVCWSAIELPPIQDDRSAWSVENDWYSPSVMVKKGTITKICNIKTHAVHNRNLNEVCSKTFRQYRLILSPNMLCSGLFSTRVFKRELFNKCARAQCAIALSVFVN